VSTNKWTVTSINKKIYLLKKIYSSDAWQFWWDHTIQEYCDDTIQIYNRYITTNCASEKLEDATAKETTHSYGLMAGSENENVNIVFIGVFFNAQCAIK